MSAQQVSSIQPTSTRFSETHSCPGSTVIGSRSGPLGSCPARRQVLINGWERYPLSVSVRQKVSSLVSLESSCSYLPTKTFSLLQQIHQSNALHQRPLPHPSLLNTIRSHIAQVPIVPTHNRIINLAPWPLSISSSGTVTFVDNGRQEAEVMRKKTTKPDILILATGYTQSFPFLDATYSLPSSASIRGIWNPFKPDVAFIGFLRPSFGAIPPLSELQSQLWVLSLLNKFSSCLTPQDHYKLHHPPGSRIQYGVDHESYAYQLALDMGSAASIGEVLGMGWKVAVTWALGANVNVKFRLVGPWKWEGAGKVMETEIWETVSRRRGFFGK